MASMDELRKRLLKEEAYERIHGRPREADDSELVRHAEIRRSLHEGKSSSRPLSDGYELIGLKGEAAFCEWAGIEVDTSIRPHGSQDVNYRINGLTINVYAARRPVNLLVAKRKARSDIYVLCAYRDETGDARLLGWATKEEVKARKPRDVGGFGILSHAIPANELRPMPELRKVLRLDPENLTLF